MNGIKFAFHGGLVSRTDYYQSIERSRGQSWLVIHERVWHVLLPGPPQSSRCIQARPVEDAEEPDGWAWCLDIDGKEYLLPMSRISGERPGLPDPGGYLTRTAVIYTGTGPRLLFGTNAPGLQSTAHRIWLTRDMRVGYKSRS